MQTTANVSETGDNRLKRQVQKRIALPKEPGIGGGNWIAGAVKHPGALHRQLGVPQGQKIPAAKLATAARSGDPTLRRRASLAETFRQMQRGK